MTDRSREANGGAPNTMFGTPPNAAGAVLRVQPAPGTVSAQEALASFVSRVTSLPVLS